MSAITKRDQLKGYGLVILAAALWGSLGLFYKLLIDGYGLAPLTAAFFRAALPACMILGWLLMRKERVRRMERQDVGFFMLFGAVGIAAFYLVYGYAVDLIGVGVAAVLLYTAPVWVTILSALFLGEVWNTSKGLALGLVIVGTALIVRIYRLEELQLNALGILMGLASGLTYGLYTIFGKIGIRRHDTMPMIGYALAFGTLIMLPFQALPALQVIGEALVNPGLLLTLLGMAVLQTLLPTWSFMQGMRYLPASNASITATFEPVVALVLGGLLLQEEIELWQWVGAMLILAAVIVLNLAANGNDNVENAEKENRPIQS